MKILGFILFFTIFFGVFTAGNFYVYNRGMQALSPSGWQKQLYIIAFIFLWFSFIASRFTGHTQMFTLHHILTWIGSFWLAIVFYLFLAVLLADIVRLFNYFIGFLPSPETIEYLKLKKIAFGSTLALVGILIIYGHLNAITTRVSHVEINSPKNIPNTKTLTVGLVSDIHLGTLVGKYRLEKLVRLMNNEKPDVILLAGDLLDEAQEPILNEDIGAPLRKLNAPLGVYAIPGNHEYIGGILKASNYIKSIGIKLLKDSTLQLGPNLYLIGRDDIQANRFEHYKRKELSALMQGIDNANFIISMDHQPYNLGDVQKHNIDLQVSGHTHNGQFWPFNYLTNAIFEVSHGYAKKGNTNIYVSNGYGTWGPPVRIGNRPEIAIIKINFQQN